ncbi:CdaR family protein [Lysinibacillus sp. FSL K6-0232]|uniref:CdaR family protein n=1 Tax=Lysinibacillus sp. FSL K6-0232 TaxID=2921425 RepID=UPI0030F8D0DF
MDKMMDSPWVLRIIALFLAFLLFFSVRTELSPINKTTSNEQKDVIHDVPVDVYYDNENFIVTGLPETVDVTIEGPMALVLKTKASKDFSVFVDLSNLLMGEHDVNLQYENISEKLDVTLDPETVRVNIEEKVTQEFRVDPEMNSRLIEEGYILKDMVADPPTVYITGAKSAIESISYVKATVTGEQGLKQSFSQEAAVKVLDRDLNKLDVIIEPETVKVQIDIGEYSRELPVVIRETGKAANNITINSLTLTPKTMKVYGKKSIIDALADIPVTVDLSTITESKTYEIDVKLPDGVTKVSDKKVKVEADITRTEQLEPQEQQEQQGQQQEQQTTPTVTEETPQSPPPAEENDVTDDNTTTDDKNTSTEETENVDS